MADYLERHNVPDTLTTAVKSALITNSDNPLAQSAPRHALVTPTSVELPPDL